MSLIMLLNKIQTVADLSEFFTVPAEDINRIVKDSPMTVIDIIAMVMRALCTKLNLTSEETCSKKQFLQRITLTESRKVSTMEWYRTF